MYYIVADIRCCHALEQCIDKISGRIQMRLAKRNRDKVRLFSNSDTSAVFMQIVISACVAMRRIFAAGMTAASLIPTPRPTFITERKFSSHSRD